MDDALLLQKYHGLGNDYLVLDPNKNKIHLLERHIVKLCRRNIGAGADGILYGPIWQDEKLYVKIFNPDGSEAERSGNGVRIFAKYLLDAGYIRHRPFSLYTKAGEVRIDFLNEDGSLMKSKYGNTTIYRRGTCLCRYASGNYKQGLWFFTAHPYRATCVSMGNPNCVIHLDEISKEKAMELGPYVENASYFPNRINMQLCKVMDRGHIRVEIYERGAGYTLASGTGACAAAAASHKLELVDDRIEVTMPGGQLLIEIGEDGSVFLTGEVQKIGTILMAEHFLA